MSRSSSPVKAVLIGAGDRGQNVYGRWSLRHQEKLVFVAVAEPDAGRREKFAVDHGIPENRRFTSWEELLDQGLLAKACLVCTQDQMHVEPAIKALRAGYHVLLEKPMAITAEGCKLLVQTAEETGKQLRICHVVRYTELFARMKKAVKDGLIGNIVNIEHSENIAYWHYAHSYVRGPWRRADEASPIILTKTCHDFDILYWLVESPVKHIQSFGELSFYCEKNAPSGAPKRCTDGCPVEETCPWYAPRFYVH
ncbi:MAG: Gfo/Idh/MocA family protein [Candidatus Hodarchaeales archaeon]